MSKSKWSILSGQESEKPIIVRRNNSVQQYTENSDFIYRVGISIRLLEPNEAGLPSKEEMNSLDQIEDELNNQLEKDGNSIQVLVITTDGMREFVYYTRNSELIAQVIYNIRNKFTYHEIQFYVKKDKELSVYKEFI